MSQLEVCCINSAQVSHLVQRVERPVGGGQGREDGAAQLEGAGPDLERWLEDGDGGGVARLGEQLLPDHRDDDEGRLVQLHGLQLAVGGLQGACTQHGHKVVGCWPCNDQYHRHYQYGDIQWTVEISLKFKSKWISWVMLHYNMSDDRNVVAICNISIGWCIVQQPTD